MVAIEVQGTIDSFDIQLGGVVEMVIRHESSEDEYVFSGVKISEQQYESFKKHMGKTVRVVISVEE